MDLVQRKKKIRDEGQNKKTADPGPKAGEKQGHSREPNSGVAGRGSKASPTAVSNRARQVQQKAVDSGQVVAIAGMHRSGTSLVSRLLNLCGLYLGPESQLMPPAADNPNGFWEHLSFVNINDAILQTFGGAWDQVPQLDPGWEKSPALAGLQQQAAALIQSFRGTEPWGWKDPRNSLTLNFWLDLLPQLRVVVGLRNPLEVAQSLHKRNGFPLKKGLELWYAYNFAWLSSLPEDQRIVTHYHAYFENAEGELTRLSNWLGWDAQELKIATAVCAIAPSLRHHELADGAQFSVEIPGKVKALYSRLCEEAGVTDDLAEQTASTSIRFNRRGSGRENRASVSGFPADGPNDARQATHRSSRVKQQKADTRRQREKALDSGAPRRGLPQGHKVDVSIVIPVYNQVDYTRKCLKALYENSAERISFEVIVVDNASEDATAEFLQQEAARRGNLLYIRNSENWGFAKACNQGARAARGKYLLFLNNDTEPLPGWLDAMVSLSQAGENVGIVGAKLLYPNGTIQHAGISFYHRSINGSTYPWPYHDFRGVHRNHPRVSQNREAFAVTGACLLIEKSLFEAVGEFDESYPMYFEDVDLNLKVRQKGYRVMYCADSEVIHHEGKSSRDQRAIDKLNLQSAELFLTRWQAFLKDQLRKTKRVEADVLWSAPFFNPSGYASEAISFALGLETYTNLRILHDNPFYSEEFVRNLPAHWREQLFRLHGDDPRFGAARVKPGYIFISHQPAHSFKKVPGAKYYIGRTMFETDRIPDSWVQSCNAMDEIWVPSRFNYNTFKRAGVEESRLVVIPEAIDTDVFNPELVEPLPLPEKAGFNFLSIFEWTERKGWDVLLRSYFEAFSDKDDVCLYLRTYLLGHYDHDTEQILRKKIDELIRKHRYHRKHLPRYVLLTQQLPFEQIPRLYKAADAFVLPSRGEGWGRPYMEAMSMGLPVIGTNWSGNTEFMSEENAFLIPVERLVKVHKMEMQFYLGHKWAQPSKRHLKKLMRYVFENPRKAREKGRRARRDIVTRYNVDAVAKIVAERLAIIEERLSGTVPVGISSKIGASGEKRPSEGEKEAAGEETVSVVWEGSQFVHHSLALVNRELTRRLIEAGMPVSVLPYEKDQFRPEPDSPYFKIMKAVSRPMKQVDVHVRHQWPPKLTPPPRGHWVVIQPWEFGSLPETWAEVFAREVDEIWVPSRYVRKVYIRSGVPANRVFVIPNGVDPEKFHSDVSPYPLKTSKKFKFLFVGGTIYRKGIDILLNAYLQAFKRSDDVCLVIKDMGGDSFYKGQTIAEKIAEIQQDPDAPEIEYIDQILPDEQLAGLYSTCDVLVHPYRGEGFGLPILEAMACGTPAMVTGGGAARDFCNEKNSILLAAQKIFLPEKSIGNKKTVDHPWLLEVNVKELREKMRAVYRNPERLESLKKQARQDAREKWTWDHAFSVMKERLMRVKQAPVRRMYREIYHNLRQADQLVEQGEVQKAADMYRQILSKFEIAEAYYGLAVCAERQGNASEALSFLEKCTSINPNIAGAYLLWGEMLQQQGDREGARQKFTQALESNPYEFSAYAALADLLVAENRVEEAIRLYQQAVTDFEKEEAVYLKLAELYSRTENFSQALNTLHSGVARLPKASRLWHEYFELLKAKGRFETHFRALNTYLGHFPDDAAALNEMGTLLWNQGQNDEAIKWFERAVAQNGNHPDSLKNLADAYLEAERFEEAIQLYAHLITRFPQDLEAYERMANLYIEAGDYPSARDLLRKALVHHPDNKGLQKWLQLMEVPKVYLGFQFLNQKEWGIAEQLFSEVLHSQPEQIHALLGMGKLEAVRNHRDEALRYYERALALDAENTEALSFISELLLQREQWDAFENLFVKHLSAFTKDIDLHKVYIRYLIMTGQFEEALKYLDRHLRQFPDDADGYVILGELFESDGRLEQAAKFYQKALECQPGDERIQRKLHTFSGVDLK